MGLEMMSLMRINHQSTTIKNAGVRAICLCLLLLAAVGSLLGQTLPWKSYTNTDDIRGVLWHDGRVWCATGGGLMAYRPQNQSFQVWTNSEGLTGNDLQAIGIDQHQRVWVGVSNGDVNIYDPATGSIIVRDDMENAVFEITAFDTTSDWVLVGNDKGLAIYREGEGVGNVQIAETVPRFGSFPSEIRVSDIAVVDSTIWVSTTEGVARASIEDAPLRPPTVWTTYNFNDGLPQNDVVALTRWQGTVVAGTGSGIARFNGQQFELMGYPLSTVGLYTSGDSLLAWVANGLFWWNGTAWQLLSGNHYYISSVTADAQSGMWAGHANKAWARGSLAYFSDGQWSDRIIRNGISWNRANSVFIDSQKRLWVTGDGLNMLDGAGWHNWTSQDTLYNVGFFNNQGRNMTEDATGGIWAGSFGGGVIDARAIENDTLLYDYYGNDGSENPWLIGIPGYPYFIVVQDLKTDNGGNVWIVNRGAQNGNMLVQVPHSYIQDPHPDGPNTWNYVSVLDQNLDADQTTLIVDSYGRVWVAGGDPNDSPGKIYVLEGGIENPTWFVISFEEALYINEMAIDQTGTIWFATRDGVKYAVIPQDLDAFNIQPFYGAVSGNVQCVHVDAQNNKWFGTDRGVSVLSAAFTWSFQFLADSGPVRYGLAGSNVLHITSNYATGDVWIATTAGLSLVKTPYRISTGPLSSIKIYPNPFLPGDGNLLQFKTVDFQKAFIFSITGKRIRELSAVEAISGWDGRDSEGDFVGSGIYMILVTNAAGDSKLGKVAVIR
jgi:ligand-binding sensor domain-containing protein